MFEQLANLFQFEGKEKKLVPRPKVGIKKHLPFSESSNFVHIPKCFIDPELFD